MRAPLVLALALLASPVAAQDARPAFDTPSRIYLAAAAADWTSTVYAFSRSPYVREANPLYSWTMPSIEAVAGGRPASAGQIAATVALSAGFDIASTWLVDRYVTPRHPKVAKVLKVVGIAVRSGQAARNVARVQSLPEHLRR